MLDFNMEYYRAFYYVAQLKSISKAAQALYISQPAVSQAIQKLEQYFDTKLFSRKSRSTELTPAGRLLFTHVQNAFTAFLHGEKELIQAKEHSIGTLSVSATETPLHSVILPALEIFRKRYPAAKIRLYSGGSTASSLERLHTGETELAMGVTPFSCPDEYTCFQGTSIPVVAVAGKDYQVSENDPLTALELSRYPIICPGKDSSAFEQISRWFMEQGTIFEPAYSVQTTSAIEKLTENNYGIGILPEPLIRRRLNQGKLKKITLKTPFPERNIIAMHKNQLFMHPLCEAFLNILFEHHYLVR